MKGDNFMKKKIKIQFIIIIALLIVIIPIATALAGSKMLKLINSNDNKQISMISENTEDNSNKFYMEAIPLSEDELNKFIEDINSRNIEEQEKSQET